jgi:nicotinamide phosphoribosyltransferase
MISNHEGWQYILGEHGGRLPLKICALPEGTIVKPGTSVMSIENTDPKVPWLTNYVESLLMHCYSMTTTATISYHIYKTIKFYCDLAGETVSPVHLNDFGLRGASSLSTAETCGIGHLLIFQGTDNIPAIEKARWYYNANVCGGSVIAAEHSTITSWGIDHEGEAYRHIIEETDRRFGNDKIISIVCDGYDQIGAVKKYFCGELKELILSRKGKIVIRPDNGWPPTISSQILDLLWESYGGITNKNGYKVLNPKVGMIYGDHIDQEMVDDILFKVVRTHKFAPSNIIFGSGGALLQKFDRDTCNFAIKCSAIKRNGIWYDVKKTTQGKESKSGRFNLPVVYENGELVREEDFNTIKKRIINGNGMIQ